MLGVAQGLLRAALSAGTSHIYLAATVTSRQSGSTTACLHLQRSAPFALAGLVVFAARLTLNRPTGAALGGYLPNSLSPSRRSQLRGTGGSSGGCACGVEDKGVSRNSWNKHKASFTILLTCHFHHHHHHHPCTLLSSSASLSFHTVVILITISITITIIMSNIKINVIIILIIFALLILSSSVPNISAHLP